MQRSIQRIPTLPRLKKPKRVAAYARVSSGKDAMLHSLSAQVSEYSKRIQEHPGWLYAGVYSDEAFTGTREDRDGFQRLLTACREGSVDIVLTKSISRFARNTVTLLETVRELKEHNVDVYFEEEGIHSLSYEGELMMSVMASIAQEESRSASENQKWRIRKGFQNGELLCWRFLYGYRIKKDEVVIDESEAQIVREIFDRFINGESETAIAKSLNARGILSTFDGKWHPKRIHELLSNEKYTGNAMLQKSYVCNHLEKKQVKNDGEFPRYYAENTHPAIICQEVFDMARERLEGFAVRFGQQKAKERTVFSGKIRCKCCGNVYKRVTRKAFVGWNCKGFVEHGPSVCQSNRISEESLKKISAEVLGISEFDPDIFRKMVDHIDITGDRRMSFVLSNGRSVHKEWERPSRKDSWTPEMREQARHHACKRWEEEKCRN